MPRSKKKLKKFVEVEESESKGPITVRGHWVDTEDVSTHYANHIFVRLQDGVFLLMFGQSILPAELNLDPKKLLEEGLPINPVFRVVIPPERMGPMVDALQRVHKTYLSQPSPYTVASDRSEGKLP